MNSIQDFIETTRDQDFEKIDFQLAQALLSQSGEKDPLLFAVCAAASRAVRAGHSCCDLRTIAETMGLPDMKDLCDKVSSCPGIARFPALDYHKLFTFDGTRLYLTRYYLYEMALAGEIRKHCSGKMRMPEPQEKEQLFAIHDFFRGKQNTPDFDYQILAAYLAWHSPFTVITGGPGTGKTTVSASILALELERNPSLRIHLCAPTGKAQARLKETLLRELEHIHCSPQTKETLQAVRCSTIQSMLAQIPDTTAFYHNRNNPVDADLILVDEFSMVSLPLAYHLMNAVRKDTKIILAGDKNQLASVDAGSVMADLCQNVQVNELSPELAQGFRDACGWNVPCSEGDHPLAGHIAELQKNYRTEHARSIVEFSRKIQDCSTGQEIDALAAEICKADTPDFQTHPLTKDLPSQLIAMVHQELFNGHSFADIRPLAEEGSGSGRETAFALLDSFKILCAVRHGSQGVIKLNQILQQEICKGSGLQAGTPVMILENSPRMGLYNGDIGLACIAEKKENSEEEELRVYFRSKDETGNFVYRSFMPAKLPSFEAVFAMTIHKSQGSGFRNVIVVLPEKENPLLTRELLYTAITRAEKHVDLFGSQETLRTALRTRTSRNSALAERLLMQENGE